LIFDRIGTPAAAVLLALEQSVSKLPGWRVINRTSKRLQCVPTAWRLPPISSSKTFGKEDWLFVEIRLNTDKGACVALFRARPTTDPELRQAIILRLVENPKEFGLKTFFKNTRHIGASWTTLGRTKLLSWSEDELPDEQTVIDTVSMYLQNRLIALDGIPDAVQPIVDQWRREQGAG
jgi:hypothetical protein